MKKATQDIVEVYQGGKIYLMSVLEKQNDSGIMFNQRIFFLLPDKHIAYISEVKMNEDPEKINFQKPKATIPIADVKNLLTKENELTIRYAFVDGSKRIERSWVLRMANPAMAKKWYDRIQREKTNEAIKRSPQKESVVARSPTKLDKTQRNQSKVEKAPATPAKEKRPLGISRNVEVSENVKKERDMKEVGISARFEEPQPEPKPKPIERREYGTIMSQKAESVASLKPQPKEESKIVSNKNEEKQEKVNKKEEDKVQKVEKVEKVEKEESRDRRSGISDIRNTEKSKEKEPPQNTDRSLNEPGKLNKSIRSQPPGNKIEQPRKFNEPNKSTYEKPVDRNKDLSPEPAPSMNRQDSIFTKKTKKEEPPLLEAKPIDQPPPKQQQVPPEERQPSPEDNRNPSNKSQTQSYFKAKSQSSKIVPQQTKKEPSVKEQSVRSLAQPPPSKKSEPIASQQPVKKEDSVKKSVSRRQEPILIEQAVRRESPRSTKTLSPLQKQEPQAQEPIQKQKSVRQLSQREKSQRQPPPAPPSQKQKSIRQLSQRQKSIKPLTEKEKSVRQIEEKQKSVKPMTEKEKSVRQLEEKQKTVKPLTEKEKSVVKKEKDESFVRELSKKDTSVKNQPVESKREEPEYAPLSNRKYISPEQFDRLNNSNYENPSPKYTPRGSDAHSKKSEFSRSQQTSKPQNADKSVSSMWKNSSFERSQFSNYNTLPIPDEEEQYQPQHRTKSQDPILVDEPARSRSQISRNQSSRWKGDSSLRSEQKQSMKDEQIPWTFKYLKYNERMFADFADFTRGLLQELIEDIRLPTLKQKHHPKYTREGLIQFEVKDVEVKIAMLDLVEVSDAEGEKICGKAAVRALYNEFNNYHTLYEYLGWTGRLRVPLTAICELHGFVGLFKVISKSEARQVKIRQIEKELSDLKSSSRIEHDFTSNMRNIIQLDEDYYNSLKGVHDEQLNFKVFMLQEIPSYLKVDTLSTVNPSPMLRKELADLYAQAPPENTASNKKAKNANQSEKLSKDLLKALNFVIIEIDELQNYFLDSVELSKYLHEKGVGIHYLGHIYDNLQTPFQRRTLMTEMAARCCKNLLRKTLQDIILEQGPSADDLKTKTCDFLNCVLGNTYQTAALWKVLSTHAYSYYGLALNFDEINRGSFLIALAHHCRLQLAWERIKPEQAFRSNFFFTSQNLMGIRATHKLYLPHHSSNYREARVILGQEENENSFRDLVQLLELQGSPIPLELSSIADQLRKYFSYFVAPQNAADPEFKQLNLFEERENPGRGWFEMRLMAIKWELKMGNREGYIRSCDLFIKLSSKYYGEFHPIFSELYDLFSAYHLDREDFEDAVTFAKSSLVNMLKVCGTAHQKTAECYYHLALCYLKANRKQEALAHMKKAQGICESSARPDSVPCALISLKLALLHLNQSQIDECLAACGQALKTLQSQDPTQFQDEVTECYEVMTRCYELASADRELKILAEQCGSRLVFLRNSNNLEKMLKIFLYPQLVDLSSQNASNYLDIVGQLSGKIEQRHYSIAFQRISDRIAQGSFQQNLSDYLAQMPAIEKYLREEDVLSEWKGFQEVCARETINDFVSFTQELLAFLGEGFVAGSLREAL